DATVTGVQTCALPISAMFPSSRWVKAFNTVYFKTLENEAHRKGERVGIPLASDDADALETAAGLVRDAGFDPVIVGSLARGKERSEERRVGKESGSRW